MKNFKLLMILFLGVAMTTAISCTKDKDEDPSDPPATSKCYLNKQTSDDGYYSSFEYNSSKQVVKVTDYDDAGVSDGYTAINYTDGKVSSIEMYESGVIVGKFEYTYDAQGNIKEAELFEEATGTLTSIGMFVYTFSNGNLTKVAMKFDALGTGTLIEVSRNEFSYTGSNATVQTVYEIDMSGGIPQMVMAGTIEYEYDAKLNPFRGVGVNYLMGEVQFISANNVTKMVSKDESGVVVDDESYNAVFEYNTNNYPTKETQNYMNGMDTEIMVNDYDCN